MTTIDVQIVDSYKDGHVLSNYLNLYAIAIGNYGLSYNFFLYFTGITIPEGATIDAAYISVRARSGYSGTPLARIYAEDAASPECVDEAGDIDAKTKTTNYVDWTISNWTTGEWYNSPSIKTIIQELVDSYAYSASPIQLLILNNGSPENAYRNIYDYNNGSAYAAKLHIEYTVGYVLECGTTGSSFSLSGQSAGLHMSRLISAEPSEFSLSGAAVNLLISRLLSCDLGEYSLSADDASLVRSRIISVASADYLLTGNPISLLASRRLGCVSGEFSLFAADAVGLLKSSILSAGIGEYLLSGTDVMFELTASGTYILAAYSGAFEIAGTNADLLKSSLLSAGEGSFSLAGSMATLYAAHVIHADAGSYELAGTNASLLRSIRLAALVGTFSTASSSASLLKSSVLIPSAGAFETTGTNADLLKSYILSCESGSYIIDGSALGLLKGFKIDAETGEFTISGQPVNLLASRIVTTQNGTFVIIGNNAVLNVRTAFNPIWARRSNNLFIFGGYYGKL